MFTPEEAQAPSRNNVPPHMANGAVTRFSLEVLAVAATSRHVGRFTIFQLSSRRKFEKTGAASRFQRKHPKQASSGVSIPAFERSSIPALLRPSADTDAPSAEEVKQAASAHCQ